MVTLSQIRSRFKLAVIAALVVMLVGSFMVGFFWGVWWGFSHLTPVALALCAVAVFGIVAFVATLFDNGAG